MAQLNSLNATRNITLSITSSVKIDSITVFNKTKGEFVELEIVYNGTFTNGTFTLTKNATYEVTVTDIAGNAPAITFTIQKPPIWLYVTGSVMGTGAIAAIAFLMIINIRNRKAFMRLQLTAGASDDANKFLLFRKAK